LLSLTGLLGGCVTVLGGGRIRVGYARERTESDFIKRFPETRFLLDSKELFLDQTFSMVASEKATRYTFYSCK